MTEHSLEPGFEDASNSPVHDVALPPYFICYIFVPGYGGILSFSKAFLCKIKKCMMTFCQSNTDTKEPDVTRIILQHM